MVFITIRDKLIIYSKDLDIYKIKEYKSNNYIIKYLYLVILKKVLKTHYNKLVKTSSL